MLTTLGIIRGGGTQKGGRVFCKHSRMDPGNMSHHHLPVPPPFLYCTNLQLQAGFPPWLDVVKPFILFIFS